ncbi:MAG: bifunctional phosphoribosylaminoimidazolecarboxamide formyltransferase/inosine monophosphate cyclohydrolase, partial [Gammaproteobacteria bacterium TMED234]
MILVKPKTALISLSDKTNIDTIVKFLSEKNIKILSTGGTYKAIKEITNNVIEVSKFTGFEEIMGGRVKTLHPKIHAGILNKRKSKTHLRDIKNNNFENIDLVIVNFYPFEETLKNTKNHNKIIENIDVGGPTMVRSAAKNYQDVTVITSSDQYEELIEELKRNKGSTSLEFREKLSRIAFTETAYYDSVISDYFNKKTNIIFPKKRVFHTNLIETLRYGENPHQEGGIYSKNRSMK